MQMPFAGVKTEKFALISPTHQYMQTSITVGRSRRLLALITGDGT